MLLRQLNLRHLVMMLQPTMRRSRMRTRMPSPNLRTLPMRSVLRLLSRMPTAQAFHRNRPALSFGFWSKQKSRLK
jgi:hypothetical protein